MNEVNKRLQRNVRRLREVFSRLGFQFENMADYIRDPHKLIQDIKRGNYESKNRYKG